MAAKLSVSGAVRRCYGSLATANRKRVLVLAVVLYVVFVHFTYNRTTSTQNLILQDRNSSSRWWLAQFWNLGGRGVADYEEHEDHELDIHFEDSQLGHTGETLGDKTDDEGSRGSRKKSQWNHHVMGTKSVAIGSGITSKGLSGVNYTNIASKFQLFFTFIPSFCETASPGYDYHFYFSYDHTDRLFRDTNFIWAFHKTFTNITSDLCSSRNISDVAIHMVQCSHSGRPTWAQNDAMMEAYLDNVEYYYRINDDTRMITKNWTAIFIQVLRSYNPSNVGVVGPNHSGGNTAILTYDFVHRTHVDIFGFYYPRLFTDWWGDDWVTKVYRPDRSTKLEHVRLAHTLGLGQRYGVDYSVGGKLQAQLNKDLMTLYRYINYTRTKDTIKMDGKKVISMSLFGKNPKYSWGAIRNAQVAPIFFPGWKLRFYVTSRKSKAADVKSWLVPRRILNKLKQLGAEIAYVKTSHIPPVFWRYLVADDSGVDYFIVRNAHGRLTERDATAVNEWLKHQNPNGTLETGAVHCIRDHPTHANQSVVDGLWGGNRKSMHRILGWNITTLLDKFHGKKSTDEIMDLFYRVVKGFRQQDNRNNSFSVLTDILWPLLSTMAYCHDSVSCDKWPRSVAFPVERQAGDYVGRGFDQHLEPIANEYEVVIGSAPQKCTNVTRITTTTPEVSTTTAVKNTSASKNDDVGRKA